MRRWFVVAQLILFFALHARADTPLPEVTQERLDAAFADARAAVETHLGKKLALDIPLRIVDSSVIAERVAAENLPAIRLRQPDEALAVAEAATLAEALAQFAFAKYSWSPRELLIVPSLWELNARILLRPQLTGDQALRAVLVHELVHAMDDASYGFGATIGRLATADAIDAFSAVIEGHAQHRTRAICTKSGWRDGFEAFEGSIGAVPDTVKLLGELVELMARMQSTSMSSAYRDGERFIAAIDEAGGAEAIARAFREPPTDREVILHPQWFLAPDTRPKLLFELKRGLEPFLKRFPEESWTTTRTTMSGTQVAAALALLPPEIAQRVVESLRGNDCAFAQPRVEPLSKLAIFALMEFSSDEAALYYVAAARKLAELKAVKMKEGLFRILDSKVVDLEVGECRGIIQHVQALAGMTSIEVSGIVAARGRVVAESVFSAEPIADEQHTALVVAALDLARKVEPDGAPAPPGRAAPPPPPTHKPRSPPPPGE